MGATQEVLSTQELLEQTLLQLDMRTLLVSAQIVCTAWHGLILVSPSLQRHLFLKADPDLPHNGRQANPLLKELFAPWFGNESILVPNTDPHEFTFRRGHGGHQAFDELLLCRKSQDLGKDQNPFLRGNASWRRMLVAQPPIHTLGIFKETSGMLGRSSQSEVMSFPATPFGDGLQMGEYYNIILNHSFGSRSNGFFVIWTFDQAISSAILEHRLVRTTLQGQGNFSHLISKKCETVLVLYRANMCVIRPMSPEEVEYWAGCGVNLSERAFAWQQRLRGRKSSD
jgi:hypothetical protein